MTITLRQVQAPTQRLDLRGLLPTVLAGMPIDDVRRWVLRAGNRRIPLGQLFDVSVDPETDSQALVIHSLNGRIDFVGGAMDQGSITIHGDVGDCAGDAMRGGRLTVYGNAGDLTGRGLHGGHLEVHGDTGDRVGGPADGERQGQRGGVIRIRGNAGERAAERMRRGMLIIEGDTGALTGYRMIAGTVFVGGQVGERAGYGMHRGTLLLRRRPQQVCPTLRANGRHRLPFLALLLGDLQRIIGSAAVPDDEPPEVERYLGAVAVDGRGELLILR